MKRIALAALVAALATAALATAALATAAQAQGFVTMKPGKEAWWLRASFNPAGTEVRGIPVAQIKKGWCKATEFSDAVIGKDVLAQDDAAKTMTQTGFSFSAESNFDGSKTKQVATVGVYQTCGGKKGAFVLIADQGTNKVRFVSATETDTQFAVIGWNRNDIYISSCLECDGGRTLRWNPKKKAFGWVKTRGRDD